MSRLTGHNNLSFGGINWEGIKQVFLAYESCRRHLLVIQSFHIGLDTYFQDPWNEMSPARDRQGASAGLCVCWILAPLLIKSVCSNVYIVQLIFIRKAGTTRSGKTQNVCINLWWVSSSLSWPLSFNHQKTCIQNKSPASGEQLCAYWIKIINWPKRFIYSISMHV